MAVRRCHNHNLSILIGLILCLNYVNGFLDKPIFTEDSEHYSLLLLQCARKGIDVEENLLENVKTCLAPVSEDIQRVGKSMGKDTSQVLPTLCKHIPAFKECYTTVFNLVETCYDELFETEVLFTLTDMVNNAERAFCREDKDDRILEILNSQPAVMPTLMCAMKHYSVMMEDLFDCPAVKLNKLLLLNPSSFRDYSVHEVCNEVDKFEKCLMSVLDLCDKQELITKFVKNSFDLVVSLTLRCPKHPNFE